MFTCVHAILSTDSTTIVNAAAGVMNILPRSGPLLCIYLLVNMAVPEFREAGKAEMKSV